MTNNELIEKWLGNECQCTYGTDNHNKYWKVCPMHHTRDSARPFETDDSLVYLMLNKLESLYNHCTLKNTAIDDDKWTFHIFDPEIDNCIHYGCTHYGLTIAAAVSSAVLELIRRG